MIELQKLDFDKMNGLLPAAVMDVSSGQLLMIGFMNREALAKTIETGLVTFFSRTKNRLWTKGETSGNILTVREIKTDCDSDSLLIYAEPKGNVCHTGSYSCFGEEKKENDFITTLQNIIKDRKIKMPENSYTTSLFKSGTARISQKVGEEAVETVIASMKNDRNEIIEEASDLVYHLLVLLAQHEIDFKEIKENLAKRHAK